MSDNTPQEEVRSIPQEVADDLDGLAADVHAMSSRAARSWKITAIVWVILLTVIASYLYILVYRPLKNLLTPETIVQMGFTALDSALQSQGAPSLQNPKQVADWASLQARDAAPVLVRDLVRPQLQQLIDDLPRHRMQLTERFRTEGPGWINDGVRYLRTDLVPKGRKELLTLVNQKADELLAQFGGQIEDVVAQVIAETDQLVTGADLRDQTALKARIEAAFEEAMGPVLDEVLTGLDEKVFAVGELIEELVQKYRDGNLTHQETLEVRLIQLTLALFEGALDEIPTESSELLQLREALQDAGVPMLE